MQRRRSRHSKTYHKNTRTKISRANMDPENHVVGNSENRIAGTTEPTSKGSWTHERSGRQARNLRLAAPLGN